jgi:hypothetical protein
VRKSGVRGRGLRETRASEDESAVEAPRDDRAGSPQRVAGGADPFANTFFIGCFAFDGTGVQVHGRPSFGETRGAFDFVTRAHRHSGFWLADMILYIESREDFGHRRDELISAETGLAEESVNVYRSIGKSVPRSNRVEGVGFGHHAVVAKLDDAEQVQWLQKSKAEGWTRQELQSELRSAQRIKLINGRAEGIYDLEVVLHVSIEAPSIGKAETGAKDVIDRPLKVVTPPMLTSKVANVRPR